MRDTPLRQLLTTLAVTSGATLAIACGSSPMVEWPYVGADQAHTKYSPLADISPSNVAALEVAWRWNPEEKPFPKRGARPGAFQATPLMVDDTLYVSTMYTRLVALDAETGIPKWIFDPKVTKQDVRGVSRGGFRHRGIAFRREGKALHIFLNSRVRLYAIDGHTGQPVPDFGDEGSVLLTEGHGRDVPDKAFDQTSPPVVFEDLIIVGSRVPDRIQRPFDTPGSVQAFDARTGERRWIFFTIPKTGDAFGADTWQKESWRQTGHANVWGLMSLDEERGLLYVPTGTSSGDFWGGHRHGANLFAESLVCLDARTGERRWHFQAVHHGLWDYDFAAAPNLVTITVGGRTIDAVAEVSKQGFTYVFDRVTGEPVWPIEERPVTTTTDVPGEAPHPTQPFPTKPPPFARQGVSLDDANDLTPEIHALALEEMRRFTLGSLFTPPTLEGTLQRPRTNGGANWGGAGFDPATGLLYVKATEGVSTNQVCEVAGNDPDVEVAFSNNCPHGAASFIFRGRPGAVEPARGPLGPIPLVKPPYATLTAIDLHEGEIAWQVPFGEGQPAIRGHPLLQGVELPDRLGTPGPSGPIVTGGGLVFAGGGDPYLYAFDKATGEEVWRGATPHRTNGTPMTYRTSSRRQFIVVATGGGPDASLVAFSLPTPERP